MPSKSPAQARLMAAAAHDPDFARRAGVSQNVAKEFNQADKGTGILTKVTNAIDRRMAKRRKRK